MICRLKLCTTREELVDVVGLAVERVVDLGRRGQRVLEDPRSVVGAARGVLK